MVDVLTMKKESKYASMLGDVEEIVMLVCSCFPPALSTPEKAGSFPAGLPILLQQWKRTGYFGVSGCCCAFHHRTTKGTDFCLERFSACPASSLLIPQYRILVCLCVVRRKREAREVHDRSEVAKKTKGLKAKILNKERRNEKIQMKKTIQMHEEKKTKKKEAKPVPDGAVPAYLMDREGQSRAKSLNNMIKQKRKEKAGKWAVPLPKVKAMDEMEVMKVVRTGKSKRKAWKRMITKHTYVGEAFTRKAPKYERFIRPMALRSKKAHVTHPELKATFCLPIIGVKKNPNSPLYTQLGVITKGTVIEVNVSELGLVTTGGKVVWGKYAQVTNNPENDGCINAVLLV